jgi:hypothetical protein
MNPKEVYDLLEKLREDNDRIYVRLERYLTVEKIVFGLVGVALIAVATSLMALVVGTKT